MELGKVLFDFSLKKQINFKFKNPKRIIFHFQPLRVLVRPAESRRKTTNF